MGRVRLFSFAVTSAITFLAFAIDLPVKPLFSSKNIEKNLAKVKDSLYAWRYETSNKEYNTFLQDIFKKDSALYEKCLTDSLGWRSQLTYCEPMVEYYHRHPGFFDYPLVNVSYEAANEYCKWLTEVYNTDPKRKFKKVMFMLPTMEEWEFAARSGIKGRRYPWGKNFELRDKDGMFLCNFKYIDEASLAPDSTGKLVINDSFVGYTPEGKYHRAWFTASVKSFWPNDFGIYNMSGNAAEMVREKNLAMGGSWNSYGGEVTTTSVSKYESSAAEVGFRVFMKIIE